MSDPGQDDHDVDLAEVELRLEGKIRDARQEVRREINTLRAQVAAVRRDIMSGLDDLRKAIENRAS